MALDDFFESEVLIAVLATAVVMSPKGRKLLRRGAVLGLAGALTAGDALSTFGRGVAKGAQETVNATAASVKETVDEGRRERRERAEDAEGEAEDEAS
jgi:hypothetical protein